MAGMISIRTTKAERDTIKTWCKQRGVATMSELIRIQLGFEPGLEEAGTRPLDSIQELESVEGCFRVLCNLVDRFDDQRVLVNKIARKVGVQMPGKDLDVSANYSEYRSPKVNPPKEGTLPVAEGFDR
jgi:hypothetical protein